MWMGFGICYKFLLQNVEMIRMSKNNSEGKMLFVMCYQGVLICTIWGKYPIIQGLL